MASTGTAWISYLKLFLISAGSVSLAMAMRFTVPAAMSEVLSWMKPPYLYIVINAIIITIAISYRSQSESSISVESHPPPPDFEEIDQVSTAAAYGSEDRILELHPVILNGSQVDSLTEERVEADNLLTYNPPPEEIVYSPEIQLEYLMAATESAPPISHRRSILSTPDQGIMVQRVAREDTLEDTWKRIMEEKSRATQEVGNIGAAWPLPDRIRDHVPDSPPRLQTSARTRKESLPRQDELNRRVEDFIRKVNDELRLQRVHGYVQ